MSVFFTLLGVAVIAYRVFVKGESIIVKNPNMRIRLIACLALTLSLVAFSSYFLVVFYLHHVPILTIQWITFATGVVGTAIFARSLMRLSPQRRHTFPE